MNWTRAQKFEQIVKISTGIYYQRNKKENVGECLTKYIFICQRHD